MSLITRDDMVQTRSPVNQRKFALDRWDAIYKDSVEKRKARLNTGDYKEFREEYIPFSAICVEYYEFSSDCLCGLAEIQSGNHDAVVHLADKRPHIFEFTKVIDGKSEKEEMKQLNSDGSVFNLMGEYDNVEFQTAIARKAVETATKKTLKTYQTSNGPSTLVIQVSCEEFHEENPHHKAVSDNMISQLKTLNYRVDDVVLMKLNFNGNGRVYNYVKIK